MKTCLSCMLSSSSSVLQVGDGRKLHHSKLKTEILKKLTKSQIGNGRNLNDCGDGELISKQSYSCPTMSSHHCDWKASRTSTSNDMPLKLDNISTSQYTPKEMMVASQVNLESAEKSTLLLPKPLSMTQLLNNTPEKESRFCVAYQGAPGAYAEAAAVKAFPSCELVAYDHFETVFQAVDRSIVDYAIVPIENSLCGSTYKTFDLMLQHGLHIIGEVQLPVHHCLLAASGVRKEQVKRVISHPQALEQCEGTLAKLGVVCKAVEGTADAAKFIAQNGLQETAAIASMRAAELYGLDILATGVEDDADNVTRFLTLARDPIVPQTNRPFKTCIVFTLEEGPGMLFKALSAFYIRGIKLRRIESRPQKKRPLHIVDHQKNGVAKYFDYLFYVDFEASMADNGAQNALQQLQEIAPFLRILGSYPVDASEI